MSRFFFFVSSFKIFVRKRFFFFFRKKKGLSACLNREFKTKDRKEKKKKKSYRCILYSVHYGLHLNHSGQHHPFFLFFFSFWSGGWWWRRRQQQNTLPHANRQRPTRKKSKGWSQKDGEIIIIKKTRPKSTAESSFAVSSVLFFKFFVFLFVFLF